jgi:hypothetical protein
MADRGAGAGKGTSAKVSSVGGGDLNGWCDGWLSPGIGSAWFQGVIFPYRRLGGVLREVLQGRAAGVDAALICSLCVQTKATVAQMAPL